MNLIKSFNINNKDIITIVGAGGKTSLMFSASSLLRKNYKVLVTTTTNIYVPDEKLYDEMIMLSEIKDDNYKNIIEKSKNGVYIIGNYIENKLGENKPKIKGLNSKILDEISPYFDIVLIEGDGSKEKPLKGWKDDEPVIYNKSTKVIGVVDISSIGLEINENNIHRLDKFINIINDNKSQKVILEHLKNLALNKTGLFNGYKGEKILFINKVEKSKNNQDATLLIEKIKNENHLYINRFIYGSIFNNEFSSKQ